MENEKIIVHFALVKNVLIADIVNMPKDLIGKNMIISNELYSIRSVAYASMGFHNLFLTGTFDKDSGHYVSYCYDTEEQAQAALENYSELIAEYNKRVVKYSIRAGVINWRRAE